MARKKKSNGLELDERSEEETVEEETPAESSAPESVTEPEPAPQITSSPGHEMTERGHKRWGQPDDCGG